MAIESSSTLLKQVSALFRTGTLTGLTDGSLLDRFRHGPAEEAEAAFAALVERHGPMVLQVCRRILGDRHDAEDAAQATFLVLARQARSIRRADSVASWLYGVAARVAGRARRDAARRRVRERRGAEAAMAIRRVESDEPRRGGGLARAVRGAGPAPRSVPAAGPALPPGRPELRAGGAAARLPGPDRPVAAGPGARAAARPAGPPRRRRRRIRLLTAAFRPDAAVGGRLRSLETGDGDGGGPLCSGRDRGRIGLLIGRCTGRRSFESHDLASI